MHESIDLLQGMLETIHRFSMVQPGETVLVAVSGGPDSVVLLHSLLSLHIDLGINLHVAHLNHSIRGTASDSDAQFVDRLSKKLELPATIRKIDVPKVRETLRLSLEEAARLVRYDFLEKCAVEVGAARIAVGHNADDQVETVLMNLLRGTGIGGLSGMPPVRGKVIRPLIQTRRAQIEKYLEANSLQYITDATNLVPEYTRNRVRLQLLPVLRSEYNRELDSGILRLSELAREDNAYLEQEAESIFARTLKSESDEAIEFDTGDWSGFALAIRRRLVRAALRRVGGVADIGFSHVETFLDLLAGGRNFRYEFPGGSFVRRNGSRLEFMSERPQSKSIEYCRELAAPGTTPIPEIGVSVKVEVIDHPIEYRRPRGSRDVVLDNASIQGMLKVRNWIPGDRMHPLGLAGTKKLQDIFIDAHIPEGLRHRVPIIVDDEKVLWVAGILVSDDCRVMATTTKYTRLELVDSEFAGTV